ncbi:Uu.00g106180.m01.CDS01 [Anthostomella pinea]|uniref:Uu.00g106180.m01.CDS01 n=1 Tax=Anthostomella pinea TaxID=933095 RepID=A0AAI8YFW0_9PEZI|nr:Uu.00g106180.m01.CDS01 [Anthostomella pinea]
MSFNNFVKSQGQGKTHWRSEQPMLPLRSQAYLKGASLNHLLLNEKDGTVAVYHYTSVLKENLRGNQGLHTEDNETQSSELFCSLPRSLALETLNTLRYVLFPVNPESRSILRTLVSRDGFDADNCRLESSQPPEGDTIKYEYWGTQLMSLYDEIENPTPRGYLEMWMERKSGARYVMMATVTGVFIAVLLGAAGLAVSIFQAWVGWQQWQHPIK